jgi:PAS domain S-box-containing protein
LPTENFRLTNDVLVKSIEQSSIAHTISRVDGDMELVFVNQAFLDVTGYSRGEAVGRNCRFLQGPGTDPETVRKIRESVAALASIEIEILNYRKDGTSFPNRLRMAPVFDPQGAAIAYLGVQSDMTGFYQSQRLEQERQKMEALGRMAANVSHEIKNALQPVKLMSDLLKDWRSLDADKLSRCLDILAENVDVADRVAQDVLRFSRRAGSEVETIDADALREDVVRFVRNLLQAKTAFELSVAPTTAGDRARVHIRKNHLYQVLMNLVNNALFAMDGAGKLTLHWTREDVGREKAEELKLKAGAYLAIGVQDSGCGIEAKNVGEIFSPFFSTKPPGEGTGLGLSISYRIAREWNGTLAFVSTPKVGSKFSLYIPVF